MVIPYRGFSVKYYSFSAIQMVKDRIDELLLARPLFRREGNDDLIVAQIQRFTDLGKIRFHLARFELVELIRHDHDGAAGLHKVVVHCHVVRRWLVPRVNDLHAEVNESRALEVVLHELAPAVALSLGDLGVAIARQVDEVELSVDLEVVDLRGLARGRAHAGKVLAVHDPVDDRGFADVRPPCKRELWHSVAHKLALDLARKIDADLAMACDPDGDRIGIAVKNDAGEWTLLNGNQTNIIFTEYIIRRKKELNQLKGGEYTVKTIVTTELIKDIAAAYSDVIKQFYDAGCRNLQLDDCTWGAVVGDAAAQRYQSLGIDIETVKEQLLKVNNLALENKPADMVITSHICRGNYHSTYFTSGAYDPVADYVFARENVDALLLEYDDERSGGFEPLAKVSSDKKVVLGLITTKSPKLENEEDVIKRIHEAAKYVPLERLCLSPQCGFASCEIGNKLTEEEQWAKLKLVKEIADEVWG